MQNQFMNIFKKFSLAAAALFVATVMISPLAAFAADLGSTGWSTTSYTDYTPSAPIGGNSSNNNTNGWTTTGYTDYTPATTNTSNTGWTTTSYTDYTPATTNTSNTGWTTTSYTDYTPSYTTYTTPTYTTPTYTTPTYTTTTTLPNPTCSLSVTPNKISDNGSASVTLSWSSSNTGSGGGLTLWNDNDNIMYGTTPHHDISLSGSKTVTITGAHTFHVDVWNSASKTGRCSAAVTVTATPAPTCTISVDKSTVNPGGTVNVSWNSTNATRGDVVNLGTNLPASGSHAVTLGNTTTFSGTFYGANGKTATCSKTVTVTQPQCPSGYTGSYPNCQPPQCPSGYTGTYPNCVPPQQQAPTCSIWSNADSVVAGQNVTVSWSSTNATQGSISNIGSNLGTSGSRTITINGDTTFTGSFWGQGGTATCSKVITVTQPQYCPAGYTGTYPNCVPPPQYCPAGYSGTYPNCVPPTTATPWCSITINNNNTGYFNANQAVTISWNSSNASYGSINQGWGNVALSGSRTIYPTQNTTYTGTFVGQNGQSVTCSATVYINSYVPPVTPNTPFITLAAVPYTGLDLGPVGTALYWGFLALWCALAAYLIVVKKVQNQVYASLMTVLFGSKASTHAAATASHSTYASHDAHAAASHADATDPFIVSQINRVRA